MKKEPLISIIVPVFNEEEVLEKTLKNIRKQTYSNYELIVVDNGSTDNSANIAKKYADRVLIEKKKGWINAMIKGFENSKGEIVVNCEADSLYPVDYLERIVSIFSKNRKIVAIYGPFKFIENGKISNFFVWIGYIIFDFLSKVLTKTYVTGGANFAILKDAYIKVGGYNPNCKLASPDFRMAKKLSKIGKVKFIPSLIVLTSNRRFKELGTIKALVKGAILWADVAFNINKIKYNSYHPENYYQNKGDMKKNE